MENDAEGAATAGADSADAVPLIEPVPAARAARRPMIDRENDHIALLQRHDLDPRLRARPLLEESELAAGEILAGAAQEKGCLKRKDEGTIEILMQAVIAFGLIAQQQGRRQSLARLVA